MVPFALGFWASQTIGEKVIKSARRDETCDEDEVSGVKDENIIVKSPAHHPTVLIVYFLCPRLSHGELTAHKYIRNAGHQAFSAAVT